MPPAAFHVPVHVPPGVPSSLAKTLRRQASSLSDFQPSVTENAKAHAIFERFLTETKRVYSRLQELGIKNEDARFVLPNAVRSETVVSANFRELTQKDVT